VTHTLYLPIYLSVSVYLCLFLYLTLSNSHCECGRVGSRVVAGACLRQRGRRSRQQWPRSSAVSADAPTCTARQPGSPAIAALLIHGQSHYTYVCKHECMCVYVCVRVCVSSATQSHSPHVCMCVCMCAYVYVCLYACMQTWGCLVLTTCVRACDSLSLSHTYTHTHSHTQAQAHILSLLLCRLVRTGAYLAGEDGCKGERRGHGCPGSCSEWRHARLFKQNQHRTLATSAHPPTQREGQSHTQTQIERERETGSRTHRHR
jgi:hypothetical protein